MFIDEAAQALEPEAVIAIGGILQTGGQLVLAGDPKQLGPSVNYNSKTYKKRFQNNPGLGNIITEKEYTNI